MTGKIFGNLNWLDCSLQIDWLYLALFWPKPDFQRRFIWASIIAFLYLVWCKMLGNLTSYSPLILPYIRILYDIIISVPLNNYSGHQLTWNSVSYELKEGILLDLCLRNSFLCSFIILSFLSFSFYLLLKKKKTNRERHGETERQRENW